MKFEFIEAIFFKDKDIPVFLQAVIEYPGFAFIPLFILFFCGPLLIPETADICWNKKTVAVFILALFVSFIWHYIAGGYVGLKEVNQLNNMGVNVHT
jgi:hypothetical protein